MQHVCGYISSSFIINRTRNCLKFGERMFTSFATTHTNCNSKVSRGKVITCCVGVGPCSLPGHEGPQVPPLCARSSAHAQSSDSCTCGQYEPKRKWVWLVIGGQTNKKYACASVTLIRYYDHAIFVLTGILLALAVSTTTFSRCVILVKGASCARRSNSILSYTCDTCQRTKIKDIIYIY